MELMEKKQEMDLMQISFHGNNEGSALIISILLIIIISLIFLSVVPHIKAFQDISCKEKMRVLNGISQQNKAVLEKYDIH